MKKSPKKLQKKSLGFASVLAATAIGALALTGCSGTGGTAASVGGAQQVTVYSADGLGPWYQSNFAAFTKATGIKVNYVEAGSGEVVSRAEKEKSNPQADILVTLPPFIQQADADGLLQKNSLNLSAVPAASKASDGDYVSLVNNYAAMIRNSSATPAPDSWNDLLASKLQGKIQYSTPGQAGDGTAVLVLLEHVYGKAGALNYLKQLQTNNVGPSSSTGKLGPKVSMGALTVANSDVQMALQSIQSDKSNFQIFFPKDDAGQRVTLPLPYVMGLGANAPHKASAEKLMAYLLSKPVQEGISATSDGLPVRSDVTPTDANYAALTKIMAGVTVYQPNWEDVLSGLNSDVAAYNNATGQ